MKPSIQETVAFEPWQALRRSLVGTWKASPAENVTRLRSFLAAYPGERSRRILHNYLTGSGFRLGLIAHPDIDALLVELRRAQLS